MKGEKKVNVREERLKILKLLESGPLKIKFLKADKTTVREMLATRELGHGPFLAKATSAEHEMIISSGKGNVPVVDLDINEKREFVFPRLLGYYNKNDAFVPYNESIPSTQVATSSSKKTVELVDDETRNKTAYLVNKMQDNVLRINFRDAKGEIQTRFGTRNASVIAAHSNHLKPLKNDEDAKTEEERAERLERDLDIGVVRYFDLMRKEFRSFNTYNLVPDSINKVPSYLIFNADGDEWFLVFKGKIPVSKLYKKGSNVAGRLTENMKKTMGPSIQALKLAENRNLATKQFRDSLVRRGDESERSNAAVARAKAVHKQFIELTKANQEGALTVRDHDLYADLVEYANQMKARLELQHEGQGDDITSIVISEVKELKSSQLVALVLNFGDNVILMHPRFVVDGVSHRVLFGKRFIQFDDARLSNNPATVKQILLDIQSIYKKYAGERLERDSKALHFRNKRAARHTAYALTDTENALKLGLDIKPCKVGLSVLSCVTQVHPQTGQIKGRLFFNQTAAYYQPEGGKRVRIYRPKTGSVKELMISFNRDLVKIGFTKEQVRYLLETIQKGYSLRMVIDTSKIAKGLKVQLISVASDAKIEKPTRKKASTDTSKVQVTASKRAGAMKQPASAPIDAAHAENIRHAKRMEDLANANKLMSEEDRQMARALAGGLRSGEIR